MNTPVEIIPDPSALGLAESMVARDDIMRDIIEETIESAESGSIKEAGRTKCPDKGSVKGPLERFPRAIDLASCPWERGGAWHTHVTPDEIRDPVNSLPDMANVVYGLLDVSVVAGSHSADVVVAGEDHEAMVDAFENSIGMSFDDTTELTNAIDDGRLDPAPARERAREALSPLVFVHETGYDEFQTRIDDLGWEDWAHPYGSGGKEAYSGNAHAPKPFGDESILQAANGNGAMFTREEVASIAFSTAVGTVVGGIVDRILFD